MTKRLKKAFVSLVASTMCIAGSIGTISAYAAGHSTTNIALGHTDFSDDWSAIWTVSCGNCTCSVIVGVDTWFGNEDYIELYSASGCIYCAAVKNSIGEIEYTSNAPAGNSTGKADVDHYGSPVTYYAFWNV